MKFKETKSQERLINLMLQAGVEWPDGAEFATSSRTGVIDFCASRPKYHTGYGLWSGEWTGPHIQLEKIPNWHQAIITREMWEARDGWITWHGGECPVDEGVMVDTKWGDGDVLNGVASKYAWWHGSCGNIIAYRISKPAEQAADDELHALPVEPCEPVEVGSKCISKLHVDVVSVSVISDIEKKAAEAEKHKAEFERCQGELAEMRKTLDDMLAVVGLKAVEVEQEGEQPTITDWRDLEVGDVVEVTGCPSNNDHIRLLGNEAVVISASTSKVNEVGLTSSAGGWWLCDDTSWKFIRRP